MKAFFAMTSILIFTTLTLGVELEQAYAQLIPNNAFILEGSGFAVTEKEIKTSEIDLALFTGFQIGTRTNIAAEDGFVTLNEEDYVVTDVTGTVLRDGRFIRLTGTAENIIGEEISISIFGRLIQNSEKASVYGFTGRIFQDELTYKIVYTTKLSGLSNLVVPTLEELPKEEEEIIIHITPGSSNRAIAESYIETGGIASAIYSSQGEDPLRARYFSIDRLTIEPGTSVTFVNDDDVSHTIVSGTGLGSFSRAGQGSFVICDENQIKTFEFDSGFSFVTNECAFTMDGRIKSGEILPGQSWKATFEDAGFYRIINPEYPWMNLVVYSFPDVDSLIIRETGATQKGN